MTTWQRLRAGAVLVLGLLGLVICLAGIVVAWRTGTRLDRANELVFEIIDTSLMVARERVIRVEKRAQASRLTSQEVKQHVERWAQAETFERLAEKLDLAGRTEKLSDGLQQANELLSATTETVHVARRTIRLGATFGARLEPDSLDPLLERLSALEVRLQEVQSIVDQVRTIADEGFEKDARSRLQRALQLTVRIAATLSEIDVRLAEFANALSQLRIQTADIQVTVQRRILTWEIVATVFLIWMAWGQVMLCRYGLANGRVKPNSPA